VHWIDDRQQSNAHCAGDICDMAGSQLRHDATTQARTFAATAGAGAVSVVLGAVLAATAPGPRIVGQPSGRLVRLAPVIEARGGGLRVEGAW
jgi:hypothetical protein